MEKSGNRKSAASGQPKERITRKELYKELVCKYYLQGLTNKEIRDQLKHDTAKTMDVRTIAAYIKQATEEWKAKKPDWAAKVTFIELEKINLLESQAWADYYKSRKPITTIKQKVKPKDPNAPKIRKRKGAPVVAEGFEVLEEVHETREQNGDIKFLLLVQWCIDKRLEILGHSAGDKPKVIPKDKDGEKKPIVPGTRTITFRTVNGPEEETTTEDSNQ